MADSADDEDEELQKAFRMSLAAEVCSGDTSPGRPNPVVADKASPSGEPPEPKRSRAGKAGLGFLGDWTEAERGIWEASGQGGLSGEHIPAAMAKVETPEERDRRIQREMRAAAAERRMSAQRGGSGALSGGRSASITVRESPEEGVGLMEAQSQVNLSGNRRAESATHASPPSPGPSNPSVLADEGPPKTQLSMHQAFKLYDMVFGKDCSQQALAQWSRQGFRFSNHPETLWGLVQREGGPCGVLAPIQALVMKHLLFPEECSRNDRPVKAVGQSERASWKPSGTAGAGDKANKAASEYELVFSSVERDRALVQAMGETLWQAGGKRRAMVAVVETPGMEAGLRGEPLSQDKAVAQALEGVSMDSAAALHSVLRVVESATLEGLHTQLAAALPIFRSDFGALLLLFSALLSRTLDGVQEDRDDPEQPLVTRPFGHASQEIVNLLLCGHAVPNVFDGSIDLGEGMRLKGIPSEASVGFLTLLESLNLCKVGQHLKNPQWPVWVVGSESHYTVLFAGSKSVMDESEVETQEAKIRRGFDELDTSGGGGFITADALKKLLADFNIDLPENDLAELCSLDVVVWNEFLQAITRLEKSRGGLKGVSGESAPPKRKFEVYHFNGIAKYDVGAGANGMGHGGDLAQQRPRLTKLKVCVQPKWTPDTILVDEYQSYAVQDGGTLEGMGDSTAVEGSGGAEVEKPDPIQNAPLVDCIRTRWQRATCSWTGDPPSIV